MSLKLCTPISLKCLVIAIDVAIENSIVVAVSVDRHRAVFRAAYQVLVVRGVSAFHLVIAAYVRRVKFSTHALLFVVRRSVPRAYNPVQARCSDGTSVGGYGEGCYRMHDVFRDELRCS